MRRAMFLLLLLSLVACGEERATDAIDPRPAAKTGDAAALLAQGWCRDISSTANAYFARCYGGTAEDWARAIETLDCEEMVADVRAARMSFDAARGTACRNAVVAASCAPDALDIEACETAFAGAIAAGESCASSSQCIEGTSCVIPDGTCNGSCTIEPTAATGERCETVRCEAGLRCLQISDGGSFVCGRPGEVDAACRIFADCAAPLWCNDGRCAAPKSAGGACGGTYRECAAELVCAGPDGAKACRVPKKIGAACTVGDAECIAGYCASSGTCALPPSIGDACGVDGEAASCQTGFCSRESNVCVERKTTGVACAESEECRSFNCASGVCQAEPCSP